MENKNRDNIKKDLFRLKLAALALTSVLSMSKLPVSAEKNESTIDSTDENSVVNEAISSLEALIKDSSDDTVKAFYQTIVNELRGRGIELPIEEVTVEETEEQLAFDDIFGNKEEEELTVDKFEDALTKFYSKYGEVLKSYGVKDPNDLLAFALCMNAVKNPEMINEWSAFVNKVLPGATVDSIIDMSLGVCDAISVQWADTWDNYLNGDREEPFDICKDGGIDVSMLVIRKSSKEEVQLMQKWASDIANTYLSGEGLNEKLAEFNKVLTNGELVSLEVGSEYFLSNVAIFMLYDIPQIGEYFYDMSSFNDLGVDQKEIDFLETKFVFIKLLSLEKALENWLNIKGNLSEKPEDCPYEEEETHASPELYNLGMRRMLAATGNYSALKYRNITAMMNNRINRVNGVKTLKRSI